MAETSALKLQDEEPLTSLAQWQSSLSSLRVDLVCDYAGNDLFAIHGESLIAYCVPKAKVDFHDGFQLLHAVHVVETFLLKLRQRGCRFHIVWFDSHEHLAVPDSTPRQRHKYLLLRAVLIHQLGQGDPDSSNDGPTSKLSHVFTAIQSESFEDYIGKHSLHFFLCLRGSNIEDSDTGEGVAIDRAIVLRQFAGRGYSLAFLDHLDFRGTKVYVDVVGEAHATDSLTIVEDSASPVLSPTDLQLVQKLEASRKGRAPQEAGNIHTLREEVTLLACARLLQAKADRLAQRHIAALLVHLEIMQRSELPQRTLPSPQSLDAGAEDFLRDFSDFVRLLIRHQCSQKLEACTSSSLCDLIDGRLFHHVLSRLDNFATTFHIQSKTDVISHLASVDITTAFAVRNVQESGDLSIKEPSASPSRPCTQGEELGVEQLKHRGRTVSVPGAASTGLSDQETQDYRLCVLPFSHPVVDPYLEDIRLNISGTSVQAPVDAKIFRETSHWHNAKKAIDPKHVQQPDWRTLRKNQRFMADTITYSASLTNASGKNIDPETIVVSNPSSATQQSIATRSKQSGSLTDLVHRPAKRGSKAGGPNIKGGKAKALEAAKQVQASKEAVRDQAVVKFFAQQCQNFDSLDSHHKAYVYASRYLQDVSDTGKEVIGAELHLYICSTLTKLMQIPPRGRKDLSILALLRSHAVDMSTFTQTVTSRKQLESLAAVLRTPLAEERANDASRSLPFKTHIKSAFKALELPGSDARSFQLKYCGPYLERSFDPTPDSRVPFNPDAWQRKVLDAIDKNRSLFVVAPTSAGKTFISFYAIKKVLQANDDDIIVYVAPTKALVNQIAAEIQARFSKSYRKEGRSVWAIHTRDYRVNNPTGCQVLVTVPHILQIMLLAPCNAQHSTSWSRRVKRIIFDEVHCIGQAEDGVIWEQLLLLSPCPIIALSATIGNPLEFRDWLASSQKAEGFDLEMVVHSTRYSDLRKFTYQPPPARDFRGLAPVERLPMPGLDSDSDVSERFHFVHPIGAMINKSKDVLEDLGLEPRDCLELWQAMADHSGSTPLDDKLSPSRHLPEFIRKIDIVKWEGALKTELSTWISDRPTAFQQVRQRLAPKDPGSGLGFPETVKSTFSLLVDLRLHGALPAILFNYDRMGCETLMSKVLSTLEAAESDYRETDPVWKKKLRDYDNHQNRVAKTKVKAPKKGNRKEDGSAPSKLDLIRDEASKETDPWLSFNPDAPIGQFSFADSTKVTQEELDRMLRSLRYTGIKQHFLEALRRGLGVHHAGMNRKYRQIVEILFRKGFLTVVIATGTLALGINMPCKTVAFVGDSVFLTALNYRQASGRSGRRGFDLLGNVVFHGISKDRVMEIMSSRLPDLRGQFPISVTLVLRLFSLLHGSNGSDYGVKALHSLLTQTRLYLGGPSAQKSIKHHLRFSIEYLRRQYLLSEDGTPLGFCGLVCHLYFTENAAFAFHSLLKAGYLHRLCEQIVRRVETRKDLLCELMTVLCHLFCRIPCTRYEDKKWLKTTVHRSPSLVILPNMPKEADSIIRRHNEETLAIFRNYVRTYVDQYLVKPDNMLPFTKTAITPEKTPISVQQERLLPMLPPTSLRSPFSALSGFTDEFHSIGELCDTVRSGVFLEEEAIPFIPMHPHETNVPFNAYILDFFKHGDMNALVRDNGIKGGDVWFRLKDFSLVLATIVTSLANFLDPSTGAFDDMAMLDVQDAGDVLEEQTDARLDVEETHANDAIKKQVKTSHGRKKLAKKGKISDSWNDDEDQDGDDAELEDNSSSEDSEAESEGTGEGKGLVDVYRAFKLLQNEFEVKFRKVWA